MVTMTSPAVAPPAVVSWRASSPPRRPQNLTVVAEPTELLADPDDDTVVPSTSTAASRDCYGARATVDETDEAGRGHA